MTHTIDEAPDYILLAHYADDTMVVVCHYYGFPEEAQVNANCALFFNIRDDSKDLIRFQLAEVKLDTTPAMLGLMETAQ